VLALIEEYVKDECPNAKPDVVSFNTLISACAKAGQPRRAEEAFLRMEKLGIVPTHVTYSAVICAHARTGQPTEAQRWLDTMISRGQPPDAFSFNSVCAAHAKVGDVKSALAVFEKMSAYPGIEASPTTRAILVNALVQAGRGDEAEKMLHALVESREPLDASSFNPLLNLHAKAGQPGRALAIMKLMQHAHVRPSLITFNSLASAYASAGDVAATEETLGKAKELGFSPDRYSYGALLQAAAKKAKSGGRTAAVEARDAAMRYTEAMLAAGIEINDYLRGAATRAVGEEAFTELRRKYRERDGRRRDARGDDGKWVMTRGGGGSAWGSVSSGGSAVASTVSTAEAEEPEAAAMADVDVDGNGGWTTVASTRSSRRPQRSTGGGNSPRDKGRGGARGSGSAAAPARSALGKSAIKKERIPPPMQPTSLSEARGDDSPDVRLVTIGVPLTRSKSERAKLLAIAQSVMSTDTPPAAAADALQLSDVPLRRSAVSELALMVGDDGMMAL